MIDFYEWQPLIYQFVCLFCLVLWVTVGRLYGRVFSETYRLFRVYRVVDFSRYNKEMKIFT